MQGVRFKGRPVTVRPDNGGAAREPREEGFERRPRSRGWEERPRLDDDRRESRYARFDDEDRRGSRR